MHLREQTIFSLSSGRPPSAIAIVRVSGPQAGTALEALAGRVPHPRIATRVLLRDRAGQGIDDAIVLWFPAPASATGEDVAEFHIHGGRAVQAALFAALAKLENIRAAEPGEFTRRAFEHSKLDLTQAEAIADLVASETEQQRKLAVQQLGGALHRLYEDWRTLGLHALAHLEAAIDFPDEDLPDGVADEVKTSIAQLRGEIGAHLDDQRGERLREGLSIAIIGPPNAGKSSLINLLAQRDVAIVSETAGTTRDVIEVHLDLGGWPVILADTAGLRHSTDAIEQEGVRRAKARAQAADLRLLVLDATDDWQATMQAMTAGAHWDPAHDIVVVNKVDLAMIDAVGVVALSATSGLGLTELLARLERTAGQLMEQGAGAPFTRVRHREALLEAEKALGRALAASEIALAAEDLRLAMRALGRITGTVRIDELLDIIFRDFCIGK